MKKLTVLYLINTIGQILLSIEYPSEIKLPIALYLLIASPLSFLWIVKETDVPLTFSSYLKFFIISAIFTLHIFTLASLFTHELDTPITIYELSKISYIKYVCLSIGVLSIITIYLFLLYVSPSYLPSITQKVVHPYLHEFIQVLISSKHPSVVHTISDWTINHSFNSKKTKTFILTSSTILILIPRLLITIALLNFSFCEGDLRWCLYCLPFIFISWILSFLDYFIKYHIRQNLEYALKVINVTARVTSLDNTIKELNTSTYKEETSVELTTFGLEEGFTPQYLDYLHSEWFMLAVVQLIWQKYQQSISWVMKGVLILRILCWINLSIIFLLILT